MRLLLSSLAERFRASMFLVPTAAVFLSILVAGVTIWTDDRLQLQGNDLPLGFTSTVESARAVLSTIAGATITFAAIAFSISLLIIQQASSQFSPRVVHTLFRDPFNRRVMALVVGTFTYCLVVLRSVRTAAEQGGDPVIPNLSVAVGVILGIATILAIVAFIDHSAHSMDISRILHDVQEEAIRRIRREWAVAHEDAPPEEPGEAPDDPAHVVRFDRNGWVQQIDMDALLRAVPEGTTVWVKASPGRYAVQGTPLCYLSVDPEDAKTTDRKLLESVSTGETRTMQQDVSFGLRQLADVALKALSPGINDPTTAQDALFHSAAVLSEVLRRDPPRERTGDKNRRVVLLQQLRGADLVDLAFNEVRRAATDQPRVCIYLLEALSLLKETLEAEGLQARTEPLLEQARLVVAGCESADLLPEDIESVKQAFVKRFGAP